MRQQSAFEIWLRTGRVPASDPAEEKFNPWHDPDDGRFTFAQQGRYFGPGAASGTGPQLAARPTVKPSPKPAGPSRRAMRDQLERIAREAREREAFKRHMIPKEGYRNDVYRDTKGYPTVGIGHKVTPADGLKVGDRISDARIDALWQQDSQRALAAAKEQMRAAGISNPAFLPALADVNFQLGVGWYKDHKETWRLIVSRQYAAAAKEAEDSKWFRDDTPKRVRAFQAALMRLELAEEARRKRKAEEARRKREAISP